MIMNQSNRYHNYFKKNTLIRAYSLKWYWISCIVPPSSIILCRLQSGVSLEWNYVKRLQYLSLCRHHCFWNGRKLPQNACWECQRLCAESAMGTDDNNQCVWTIYLAGNMSDGRKPCLQKGPIYGIYMLSKHAKFYPLDMRCDFKSNRWILTTLHFDLFTI